MDPFDFELESARSRVSRALVPVAPLPTLYRVSSIVGPRIQRAGRLHQPRRFSRRRPDCGGWRSVWWRADALLRQLPSAPLLKYPKLGTRYEKSGIKIDVSAREEAAVRRGRCGYTVKRVEEGGV